MLMIIAAFGVVLGCVAMSFAQAVAPSKGANDDALYNQTIEKITKTNDLFAAKKVSFDRTRQQQTNSGKPDNKVVCQSLAGWNLILQDRIGNNNSLIEMRSKGKFDAHLSKIDEMIASIKLDLQKNEINFDQIAGVYKCDLSGVRSDGSFNFGWSYRYLGGAKLEDFLGSTDAEVAEDWIVQGYYDAALKKLNEMIRADPKNAAAYTQRAMVVYEKNGARLATEGSILGTAKPDVEKAIEIDPKNALAYWILAEIDDEDDYEGEPAAEHKKAIDLANQAISQHPNDAENYYIRGRMQSSAEAVADFTKAIAIDSKFGRAYQKRGEHHSLKFHYYEALADFNKVIELSPKSINAYAQRGKVYYRLGEIDKATTDLRRAIELDPANEIWKVSLKYYSEPVDDRGIIMRYEYFKLKFDQSAEIFNQQTAKYDLIATPQTPKPLVCQALTDLTAAFRNQKAASDKLIFINDHPAIIQLKDAILFNKQIAEYNEKVQARFKEIAVNYACKL